MNGQLEPRDLAPAVAALRRGQVVAAATETFFGLLADARSEAAVARVLRLKGRAEGHPVALLAPDAEAAFAVAAEVPEAARRWAEAHWPGPLTLVFRARGSWPPGLCSSRGTIGVRVPGTSPALDLVRAFGGLLTATSANRSGEPPARTAEQVRAAFGERVHLLPGEAPGGSPSTIVDVSGLTPRLLRAGAVPAERLDGLVAPLPGA